MPGAYLPVSCVSANLIEEINNTVTAAMENDEEKMVGKEIHNTLFDNIQRQVEEYLATELFHSFFKSKFYASYRKKAAIQEIPMTTSDKSKSHDYHLEEV